jgi:hypothetical protein
VSDELPAPPVLVFPRLGFVSEFLVRFRSPVAITRVVRITVLFIRNPAKAENISGDRNLYRL